MKKCKSNANILEQQIRTACFMKNSRFVRLLSIREWARRVRRHATPPRRPVFPPSRRRRDILYTPPRYTLGTDLGHRRRWNIFTPYHFLNRCFFKLHQIFSSPRFARQYLDTFCCISVLDWLQGLDLEIVEFVMDSNCHIMSFSWPHATPTPMKRCQNAERMICCPNAVADFRFIGAHVCIERVSRLSS